MIFLHLHTKLHENRSICSTSGWTIHGLYTYIHTLFVQTFSKNSFLWLENPETDISTHNGGVKKSTHINTIC